MVTFKDGSAVLGSGPLSASWIATLTTTALTAGSNSITAVYGGDSNNLGSTSSVLSQNVVQTGSTLTAPTAGATFSGTSATFTWTVATGATSYTLWLGTTGPGSSNLWGSGSITSNSITFGALPTNGGTIYARLWTALSGGSVHADYIFTAAAIAAITSPTPGSIISGSSATFTWSAAPGAASYNLWLGTAGVGSNNLWGSGATTVTSITFGGLPTNGETVYVRLWTTLNGVSLHNDYVYTTAAQALMISPFAGSTFASNSVPFTWSTGTGATSYALWIGTNGVGSNNVWGSGSTTATSVTFGSLPANGQTVYVRLFTSWNGATVHADYTYTAAAEATITSPTPPGSTLTGSSQTFTWSAGTGAISYSLWVGTTGVGSSNLYVSHNTTAMSEMVTDLPTTGGTVYVRLYTTFNGGSAHVDYTYTAE
jgi:serine protease